MSNKEQSELPEWVLIEDRSIYDGWCCKLNLNTKEIVWRDAWCVERLSDEQKTELEFQWRKIYCNHAGTV